MKKIFTLVLLICFSMLASHRGWGQIAAWNNSTLSGTTAGSINATTNDAHLNTAVLSRGSGITASTLSGGYASSGWIDTSKADAITNNRYYQVTISAVSGYKVSLDTLNAKLRRSGTGPNTYIWRYSINGTTFSDINTTVAFTTSTSSGDVQSPITLSGITNLQSVSSGVTITLRLYAWGATGAGGTLAFGTGNVNSLSLIGSVTSTTATPTISIGSSSNPAEPATNGSFVLNFSAPTTASTSIDYAFSGSAVFGTDYTIAFPSGATANASLSSGTLTVPAATSSATITLVPIDNTVVNGSRTIKLDIANPTGSYALGTATATVNLLDDDVAATASVAAGTNAAEPSTNGTFIITLSAPAPAGGVTISYTLGGTATVGTDYTDPQNGSITIPASQTTGTITLTTINDAVSEPVKTINITLTAATNGYTLGTTTASINLLDDDLGPVALTGSYTQDFNTLVSSGSAITNVIPMQGWQINEVGGGARDNEAYAVDNGGSTTGDTYSYGATNATDRALGSLASGSLQSTFGAYFVNNSGATITRLRIAYKGEQWRLGATGRGTVDRLDFSYSPNATNLTSGTWTDVAALNFTSPVITGTAGALNGNAAANSSVVDYTIVGLSVPVNGTVFIKWTDPDISGADDGLAIDSLTVEANPVDITPPAIFSLTPANSATGVSPNNPGSIVFTEAVQKGTGNIVIKKLSDSSVVQTINVATAAVIVNNATASFSFSSLAYSTAYFIEISAGAFVDFAGNSFAGISGTTGWSFTTQAPPPAGILDTTYSFASCTASLPDGFRQYSVVDPSIVWACTDFGHDFTDPSDTAKYGVQINGYNGTENVTNRDWFISPEYNLTSTTYPILSFWSRTAFSGSALQLKVSTDYTGIGNPENATWTDLDGKFPSQGTANWKLSGNIDLSAYKQSKVYLAWVYNSTGEEGARWTLDDIRISNSAVPPATELTISTNSLQSGYAASSSSTDKTFTVTGSNLTGNIILTATGSFSLSKDSSTFASVISFTPAEANNLAKRVVVRFSPSAADRNYTGTITIRTASVADTAVNLSGTSIDPAKTLEIVNWNLEWFGSATNGPSNKNGQEANVKTIVNSIKADVYAFVEVVDETRLQNVVASLSAATGEQYGYVISNYGSHVNPPEKRPTASPITAAQKEALVYKKSMVTINSSRALLSMAGINTAADTVTANYDYWSSGRYPFLVDADVTLGTTTKNIKFVIVHAKANTAPTTTAYNRRAAGARSLHDTLIAQFPNDNIVILGDFNDDLDSSITAGFTTSSYSSFLNDVTNFASPTLALSLARKKSTVSYNDVIDHVMLSNEMAGYYMNSSAVILTDASSLVSSYGSTTTDHYPVFTRYAFDPAILPVKLAAFTARKDGSASILRWVTVSETSTREFVIERSVDGIQFTSIGKVAAAGNSTQPLTYTFADAAPSNGTNFYRLRMADIDGKTTTSNIVTVSFEAGYSFRLSPNPAGQTVYISLPFTGAVSYQIIDMNGKEMQRGQVSAADNKVNISRLTKGTYLFRISSPVLTGTQKLVVR